MKDFKGTKGEWKLELNNSYPQIRHWKEVDGKTRVTNINCFISDDSTGKFIDDSLCEENIANANLIAAAPELLKALQEIVQMQEENYGDGINTHMKLRSLCKEANKTINKALGNDNQ